ncbi:MAG TPA: efflux RND transporter permease subunit, partial [Candidatus Nitrosotenuis sp.]|nr:efflux RND transporter permease subunit [Candidatus Nitrosotenuis sp.]
MSLWDFCIRRPVFTTVLTSALVLFGVLGYLRMGVDLYPRIEPPVVTIQTTLRGASPEVVDQDVTEVLEGEVGSLEGVETIRSQSTESLSSITVEFALDRDIDVAAQEVRDRVGAARRLLPPEADPPIVSKIDTSASPIMWLAVTGEGPYNLLSYYADKVIKERLQTLPGVGGVMMGGFRKRAIRVWLDMDRLASYGLGPADVVRALQRWQVSLPGGRVENVLTESTIQVEGEFADVEELADLVVSWREGAAVRLRDLGRLEDGQEDARGLARFDRVPTIGLGVRKQAGGNTVAVAEAVKAALPRLQAELPDWVKIKIAFDSSRFIEGSLEGARFDILFGALFTCVVIWFFLRTLQPTLISVLAIPTSLVGTFFLMWKMGFTINQMSLLGMALAVGLVIDDAIVVLESISRHIEQGEEPARAASTGTREVAFAVMAATFSIAAIFVPVGFMQGVIGQFFQQFGLTVALTILTSLVVSLTLTPMLCSRWMRHRELHNPLSVAIGRLLAALDRGYRRLLRWCVRGAGTRLLVLGVALALFGLSLGLASRLGREFMPTTDDSRFLILFEAPLGTSLGATDRR